MALTYVADIVALMGRFLRFLPGCYGLSCLFTYSTDFIHWLVLPNSVVTLGMPGGLADLTRGCLHSDNVSLALLWRRAF